MCKSPLTSSTIEQEINMNKSLFAALLAAAFAMPFAAQAEGSYVKLAVGQSNYSDISPVVPDLKPTGVLLGLGYSFDKTWDVELGYIHFGDGKHSETVGGTTSSLKMKTQSIYLAGIGNLPVTDAFSVFGKLGIAVNQSKATGTIGTVVESEDNTKVQGLIGAGLNYQFTKELAGQIDYTYFGKVSDGDIKLSLMSVGLRYGF